MEASPNKRDYPSEDAWQATLMQQREMLSTAGMIYGRAIDMLDKILD